MEVFQKLLKAEANRRVRMCNLQSAKDCASVKTSLATVRARAQEWGKGTVGRRVIYLGRARTDHDSVKLNMRVSARHRVARRQELAWYIEPG